MLNVDQGEKADLTIVTLADEKPVYLAGFVAAHLMQGASKVIVYLDKGKENPFHRLAGKVDGLEVICCDEAFWAGERPKNVEARQKYCYEQAYRNADTEWVGLCDSDEIYVPATSLAEELEKTAVNDQVIACPVWEAVWEQSSNYQGLFSAGYARRRVRDEKARKKHFRNKELFELLSRDGLMGHVFGKYLVRRNIPNVDLRLHSAFLKDGETVSAPVISASASIQLLHYDAMSLSAWELKHQKRVERQVIMTGNRGSRVAQTEFFALLASADARRSYFDILYTVDPGLVPRLVNRGFLKPVSISDPVRKMAKRLTETSE